MRCRARPTPRRRGQTAIRSTAFIASVGAGGNQDSEGGGPTPSQHRSKLVLWCTAATTALGRQSLPVAVEAIESDAGAALARLTLSTGDALRIVSRC